MDETTESWRLRADALIQSMSDVRREPPVEVYVLKPGSAHVALFERYVHALRRAKQGAEKRWDSMVATEFGRTGDLTLAQHNVARRNPIGPVSSPGVIAVLRRYWLECDAVNSRVSTSERVRPEEFLLRLIQVPPHQELASFLSALPYLPIGMDVEGRWV